MLNIVNISKGFGSNKVLSGISTCFKPGEVSFIIGHNGSGKSTFLQLISGDLNPDSGSINFNNETISKNIISKVTQNINLCSERELTVYENLCIARLKNQKGKLKTFNFYNEIIDFTNSVEIDTFNFLDKPLKLLSGGEQQKIALLMGIISNPKILLLDEFTSALDPKTSEEILKLVRNLTQALDLITIIISHSLREVAHFADRIIMIKDNGIHLDKYYNQPPSLEDLLVLFEGDI
ncbi:MAG: ATP-binding cassette domain-containing protein [Sphingobacteriia bacterium]|nr:ATP-binding cassette domain-containing protein [Sphingobacteriia bacterium]